MKPLRVAVWGLGQHAISKILPAISAVDGLELYGVCSRDDYAVSYAAAVWNCLGWTNPKLMLSDLSVDVVYVATPIALHHQHGKQVLDANKHFWCEKPLTSSLKDSMELLESAKNKGLSMCEGHMFLHHPQFQNLKKFLNSDQLGKILSVDARFGIPTLENPGFRSNPALGGGAFFDVGCYPVAAILDLFLEAEVCVNYAKISELVDSVVDTNGEAIVNISNGVSAHLEWRIHSSYRNEINIWGKKGSLFTTKIFSKQPDYSPHFYIRDAHGIQSKKKGIAANHFQLMFRSFMDTIYSYEKAELERKSIIRRAILMDQIWTLGRIS